jgi:hypothetical protein
MSNDPFAVEGNFQAPKTGHRIPWERITPIEHQILLALGERAWQLVGEIQKASKHPELVRVPAPTWAAAEFGVAHLCRDLDLQELLASDDLAFMADYVAIVRTINRRIGHVPNETRLRFARK